VAANDYIAAYPPVCATSDRGDGKMRITWPAWGLDEVLHAALTTSHYVANVTLGTPESKAILATGGTKSGGFWIDIDETFSGSSWLNTHRYSPQRQSTVYYYTSFNLARAAMITAANHDNMILWDFNTAGTMMGTGVVVSAGTAVDISGWGGRANQQNGVVVTTNINFYQFKGDLSAHTLMTWQNLAFSGGYYFWYWNATSGMAGGGLTVSRCVFNRPDQYLFYDGSSVTLAPPITFSNCYADLAGTGWNAGTCSGALTVQHCTFINGLSGIVNNSKTGTYVNNLGIDQSSACYQSTTNATFTKCASTDATGSEAGLRSLTRAQLALWSLNDGGNNATDAGILATSTCYQAGANTTETIDLKGNARHSTTPSLGCYEGSTNALGVTWPTGAQSTVNFTNFAGAVTGTAVAEAHANSDVRFGVGSGTCKVPVKADVRLGTAVDVADIGELPTNKAKISSVRG